MDMEGRVLVLASHGDLAEGMRSTLSMVLGKLPCEVRTFCLLPGHTAQEFAARLLRDVEANPEVEFVLLTDIYGASVFTALCPLVAYPNVRLFTGMNVAMALSVLIEHSECMDEQQALEVAETARDGARFVPASDVLSGGENEDF